MGTLSDQRSIASRPLMSAASSFVTLCRITSAGERLWSLWVVRMGDGPRLLDLFCGAGARGAIAGRPAGLHGGES